jgi:hypothetical protein
MTAWATEGKCKKWLYWVKDRRFKHFTTHMDGLFFNSAYFTDLPYAEEQVQRVWGIPYVLRPQKTLICTFQPPILIQRGRSLAAWREPAVMEEINISPRDECHP